MTVRDSFCVTVTVMGDNVIRELTDVELDAESPGSTCVKLDDFLVVFDKYGSDVADDGSSQAR